MVHVAGSPIAFAAETDRVPANIDHFWVTIGTGSGEPIRIALSTHSRQNAAAGFDPRMRVGIVPSSWKELPPVGLVKSTGLDYREIEAASPVTYTEYKRPALENLLTEMTTGAIFVEAWGELYVRNHLGIHQATACAPAAVSCAIISDAMAPFAFILPRRREQNCSSSSIAASYEAPSSILYFHPR
jgi:hypothetical protein